MDDALSLPDSRTNSQLDAEATAFLEACPADDRNEDILGATPTGKRAGDLGDGATGEQEAEDDDETEDDTRTITEAATKR